MATTPSSSTLANLAARRQAIQKTRVAIGLSSGGAPNGGLRQGAPVNGPGPASPTPAQPAEAVPAAPAATAPATEGAPTNALHPDNVPEMKTRDQALAYTKQMLDTQRNQGTPVTAPPAINQPPPPAGGPILDQIAAVGAQQMSPTMQFMRTQGRNPSGRELAMFSAVTELARQLGRNPTSNELMMYMTTPQAAASPVSIPGVNA
jgi:hypothetical protein